METNEMKKCITNAVRHLLKPGIIPVFDCDGVLAVYEIGEYTHAACTNDKWGAYVKEKKPYDIARPVSQIQSFVNDKGADNVYVCTRIASEYEKEQKLSFIQREYKIPKNHVMFVRSNNDKINCLKKIADERCNGKEEMVALIEDTVETLDRIYEMSDFLTIHVSSFFSYISI